MSRICMYDSIVYVRVPRGYADHPEDERIHTTPSLTHTNDSSFGDSLLYKRYLYSWLIVVFIVYLYDILNFIRVSHFFIDNW